MADRRILRPRPSNKSRLTFGGAGDFPSTDRAGRNLHFGVREHAAGAIAYGLALSKIRAYHAGFLIFSDFQRSALRLSALMELPVLHMYTHDSVGVGEDGPTHQPVEHIASLRAIPGLIDLRPGDANEVVEVEEVNDACLLLMLTERAFVAGAGREHTAARWLHASLDDLGIPAYSIGTKSAPAVQPNDSVVAICGPGEAPELMSTLQPAIYSRAILVAHTAETTSPLVDHADALITLGEPITNPASTQARRASVAKFELKSIMCVDALTRDLRQRVHRRRA